METKLTVCEIFRSIQGEGTRAGLPCTLVRLAGCNLRCSWCDTTYAWQGGRETTLEDILQQVDRLGCRRVEVTGGEPLIQPGTPELLRELCDRGYETLLETNGSIDVSGMDPRVIRIVDFKCPSSGQSEHNRWENVEHLSPGDEVKFVIADRADYDFARAALVDRGLVGRCTVLLGPVAGRLPPATLAEWMLTDGLDVRLNLQLHKILWPEKDRGV